MADDPLLGCWAKLGRALELITAIEQEEQAYFNADPRPVWVKGAHEGSEFVFRAFGPEKAPERFSVLAGEVIHHLRTCLDHVVWALATKHVGLPSSRIQFPICENRKGFEEALKQKALKGVRPEAVKIIESVQPFTSKGEPRKAILYVLHHLDVQDKHKLLLVTTAAAELGHVITIGDDPALPPPLKSPNIVGLGSPAPVLVSPNGTPGFSIKLKEPTPELIATSKFEFKLAFRDVTSAGAVPLVSGLKEMYGGTSHTITLLRGSLS